MNGTRQIKIWRSFKDKRCEVPFLWMGASLMLECRGGHVIM